ncbi:peptide chain release factor N(5)-glutamine methyltransferase [Aurantimonas marina]|uniref:peptide chain release factor N(5)-glutamine methyltransferase n=1 Tax=Aurantimonas marina TaxID=2780508 RepID=UPI0019CFCB33|nr:peptide chain release factor N(5)-glutamine methyltransferase [Aurantimonas marina]
MTEAADRLGPLLRHAVQRLRAAGSATPEFDARLLLAECAGLPLGEVHSASATAVSSGAAARLESRLTRRLAGEPVHRILGRRAFYEHEFELSPETLEPRPDTEILVDEARKAMAAIIKQRGECLCADIGTGSGAIAVSLLALFPQSRALAIDISAGALATAYRNAEAAGVASRMLPVLSNYLAAAGGPLDLVLSNPPYIRSGDIPSLTVEVREHDPLAALDGGEDGLDAYRAIAAGIDAVLRPGGRVIVEIGIGQEDEVAAIFASQRLRLDVSTRDFSGVVRVLGFSRGEPPLSEQEEDGVSIPS